MLEVEIPQNYDEWRHCITVKCGIPLTPEYIAERINSLQDGTDFRTRQFLEIYGQQYHQQVLAWFHQAEQEVNS